LCISAAGLGSSVFSLSEGTGAVNLLSYYIEAERPGDKGSGNTTSVDVQTPLVACLVDFHT